MRQTCVIRDAKRLALLLVPLLPAVNLLTGSGAGLSAARGAPQAPLSKTAEDPNRAAREHLERAKQSRVFQVRERELSAAIALQPDFHEAYYERGLGRMSVGEQSRNRKQLEAALQDFQSAIRIDGRRADYHFQAGYSHGLLNQFEQCLKEYERAISLFEAQGEALSREDRRTLAWCHLNGCDVLLRLNRPGDAVSWGEAAVRVAPDIPMAQYNRGRACAAARQYPGAFESFQKMLELTPGHLGALSSIGFLHYELNEFDRAAQYLGLVNTMNPRDERVLSALMHIEMERGRYSNVQWCLDMLDQLPSGVQARSVRTRGKLWYLLGDDAKARELLRQAVEKDENELLHWVLLGDLEEQEGRHAAAEECYQRANALLPVVESNESDAERRDAWASFLAATYRDLHQDPKAAAGLYEQTLDADPTHFWAMSNFALLLAAHPDAAVRDGARAMQLAERCCEITLQRVPWCLSTLAAACAELGNFEDAIAYQQQAIERAPHSEVQQYHERLELYEQNRPFRFQPDRNRYFLKRPAAVVDAEAVAPESFEAVSRANETPTLLKPETIFARNRDAVVLVESDVGFGTGMLVSRSGYILTCAHVLPYAGAITIRYLARGGDTDLQTQATVVALNSLRDLALLKIDVEQPLATVVLARGSALQAGAKVLGIGNPSVGQRIVDRVLADGIISKPRQDVENPIPLSYLQSTLRIGPGYSGGPVLNDTGRVIGVMASTRPDIGATFAVPLDGIEEFLGLAASDKKTGRDGGTAEIDED